MTLNVPEPGRKPAFSDRHPDLVFAMGYLTIAIFAVLGSLNLFSAIFRGTVSARRSYTYEAAPFDFVFLLTVSAVTSLVLYTALAVMTVMAYRELRRRRRSRRA